MRIWGSMLASVAGLALCAGAAVPAMAASAPAPVYYPPAAILIVLPGAMAPQWGSMPPQWIATPAPVPFLGDDLAAAMTRLIADQQTDLARLAAATEALAAAPDRALNAALHEMPRLGPGEASSVIMTALTTGQGSCSETVTYSYPGNGAAPQVAVRKSGNACPAGSPLVTGTEPSMIPRAQPQTPHLLEAAAPPSWAPARHSRVELADRMAPAVPLESSAAPRLEPISYSPVR